MKTTSLLLLSVIRQKRPHGLRKEVILTSVYSASSRTSWTDTLTLNNGDAWTRTAPKSQILLFSLLLNTRDLTAVITRRLSLKNATEVRWKLYKYGRKPNQLEESPVFIVSYPVLCPPVLLRVLPPVGSCSTRRFVQPRKNATPPGLVEISARMLQQYGPKKRQQQVWRRVGCLSWECVLPEWQTAAHTQAPAPCSLRRDAGRRRWAGTAPSSTDRTVTLSALTRSLPHRWARAEVPPVDSNVTNARRCNVTGMNQYSTEQLRRLLKFLKYQIYRCRKYILIAYVMKWMCANFIFNLHCWGYTGGLGYR